MNIPKRADITDTFRCPKYPELNTPVSYKFCINRQLTKLAGGGNQYLECVECVTGKQVTAHFKGYQLSVKKGVKPNWNTDVILIASNKKKRAKKGESLYSPFYVGKSQVSADNSANIGMKLGKLSEPGINCDTCQQIADLKNLVNAQVNLVIDLLIGNKLDNAMMRLGLILEEM